VVHDSGENCGDLDLDISLVLCYAIVIMARLVDILGGGKMQPQGDLAGNWLNAAQVPWDFLKQGVAGSGSPAESLFKMLGADMPASEPQALDQQMLDVMTAAAPVKMPTGFFSKLERGLRSGPPKATGAQLFKKMGQLSSDEQKLIGHLKGSPEQVRAKQVLEHVEQNYPEIERTVAGENKQATEFYTAAVETFGDNPRTWAPEVQAQYNKLLVKSRNEFIPTKWENQYMSPGHVPGSYRETLYHYKPKSGDVLFQESSLHYGEEKGKNLLMSARTSRRQLVDGSTTAHLDEGQSQWHAKGSREGYGEPRDWAKKDLEKAGWKLVDESESLGEEFYTIANKHGAVLSGSRNIDKAWDDAAVMMSRDNGKLGVANAPYKKDYLKIMARDLVARAVRNGDDGVSWSTGETLRKRYPNPDGGPRYGEHFDRQYDKDLVKFMKSEYGAEPVKKTLPANKSELFIRNTGTVDRGQFDIIDRSGNRVRSFDNYNDALNATENGSIAGESVWYIPLTPAVRQQIQLEGQRLSKNESGDRRAPVTGHA